MIPLAGVLEGDPGARPFHHIFRGQGAPWHAVHDTLPQLAERPPPEQRLKPRR